MKSIPAEAGADLDKAQSNPTPQRSQPAKVGRVWRYELAGGCTGSVIFEEPRHESTARRHLTSKFSKPVARLIPAGVVLELLGEPGVVFL